MIRIAKVIDGSLKAEITENILRQLPEWFGIEKSILEYIDASKDRLFYCAYDDDKAIGFICIKEHNIYTADIYVIGILKEYHRQGIGNKLVRIAEGYLLEHDYKFLMVKTLSDSADYEFYTRTRQFYKSVGFYPLEEIKEIWGPQDPCLIMVKCLS